ncbi:VOC family protein [Paenibacillus sp. GCM10012306]|uniref:VOC family protein n=1 Tax=Paenibacillus sp. GCM10012306 TaxID=3317342 RepID=UPI003618BCF7
MAVHKIEHVGIKVSSLETSIDFYRNVIGLTLAETVGELGDRLRLAFLSFPGQASVEVELIESLWEGLPDEGRVSHIAFTVSEIEGEYQRIESLGLEGLTAIRQLEGGSRFFFFDGPDHEKIEFFASTRKV